MLALCPLALGQRAQPSSVDSRLLTPLRRVSAAKQLERVQVDHGGDPLAATGFSHMHGSYARACSTYRSGLRRQRGQQ